MATQSCLAEEQKQPQEAPASPRSLPLPPSSPRARPSSRRQAPRASPGSRASQPGPHLRSQALPSAPGPALRSRTTLRGLAVQGRTSAPGLAPCRLPASASPLVTAPSHLAVEPPGFTASNHVSRSGTGLSSPGSFPGPAGYRQASRPGPALTGSALEPGPASYSPALNNHTCQPGPALGSNISGPSPSLRGWASWRSPAPPSSSSSSSSLGFVPWSCPVQRSAPSRHPSLPGPAGQRPPSRGLALGRLVFQCSSSSPDAEAPSLPSQQGWHVVHMCASSPSPPVGCLPVPQQFIDSYFTTSSHSTPPLFLASPLMVFLDRAPLPLPRIFLATAPFPPPVIFMAWPPSSLLALVALDQPCCGRWML
uniref:Uncharacterized protein n=1 Tax=Molossus molossus TaxID=27622 RepID=A0A7J8J7T2_MOLMO|nr:hypothetical protein HJG59_009668 [Molossus molossus]